MPAERPYVEVESLEHFDALVAQGARSMRGWHLQSIDLTGRSEALARLDPAGALFLGCAMDERAERLVRRRGGLVFPTLPDIAFDPYRGRLYSPDELYAGLDEGGYESTCDARIYAWARHEEAHHSVGATLASALHDHAITDALEELIHGRDVVGIMGGHAVRRGEERFADAAWLGRTLTRAGLLVATGGGPGSMEAANLGAYLAHQDDDALAEALTILGRQPDFAHDVTGWAKAAFDVRSKWSDAYGHSLGVPTWHYGHEPPNAFASEVAKFFRNALREDVLLGRSNAGVAFLPGAAGTIQEIFTVATANYYADGPTGMPMVLVGRSYWTERFPAWQLLRELGNGRSMAAQLTIVDTVDEAAAVLTDA